jgi:uroporphyrinogen-III decarboxylase
MTKKERFLAAVRGETPDVVPVAPLIHHRFAHKALGRYDLAAVFEAHQMIGSVHHRGPLGVGVRSSLPAGYSETTRDIEYGADGRVTSEWIIRTPKRTMVGRQVSRMIPHDPLVAKTTDYPIKTPEDWRAVLDMRQHWLANAGEPVVGGVEHAVKMMGEEGMPSVGLGPAYTSLASRRGMEGIMLDLYDYPDLMEELFEVERQIMEKHVEAYVASPSEVAWLDICWATGSNLGPKMFERWALPDVVRSMEKVRGVPGKYLGLYTLGKIRDLLPMFVDAGVHFVETFEPNQGDITLAEAKKLYGDKFCIMGNFDCVILAFGTVEDARKEARRCLNEGMEGGGYIMVTGDEVPADAKIENLRAMVETVEEFGRYY